MRLADLVKRRCASFSNCHRPLSVVGLGAYIALLLFLSDSKALLVAQLGADINPWYLFAPASFAALLLCLVLAFRSALAGSHSLSYYGIKGGAAALLGLAGFAALPLMQPPELLALGTGMIFGLGLAMLGMGWCAVLDSLNGHRVAALSALACAIGASFKLLVLLLGLSVVLAMPVLVLLSAILPLRIDGGEGRSGNSAVRTTSSASRVRDMFKSNWVLVVGFVCCLTYAASIWGGADVASKSSSAMPANSVDLGSTAGALAAALLLLGIFRKPKRNGGLVIGSLIPLICVSTMLLTWYMLVWDKSPGHGLIVDTGIRSLLSCLPVGFAKAAIGILIVRKSTAELHAGQLPTLVFGLLGAFIILSFLLLSMLQYAIGPDASTAFDAVLKIGYLIASAAYLLLQSQRHGQQQVEPVVTDERLQAFCRQCALSKREGEVLALLIQGRSAPHIAKAEYIAVSTVKTHIRRIYTKADVHSKEELLDIIYGQDGGEPQA